MSNLILPKKLKPLNTRLSQQSGMTLLELAVVLLILVTLATVALRSTTGLQEQARFEQTQNRYDAIKAAIIGDPKLIINGQPDISGFVADTGRLPACIQELLIEGFCSDNTFCSIGTCTATWTVTGYNWNGPYLTTSENAEENDAFTDGWGNTGTGNYGWETDYTTTIAVSTTNIASAFRMELQSIGCTGCTSSIYNTKYPDDSLEIAILEDDWRIDLSAGLTLQMATPFLGGNCDTSTVISELACTSAGWSLSCSNPTYTDQLTCESNGETWGLPCTGSTSSKNFCETNGGTWTYTTTLVELFITHQTGTTVSAIQTVENNGLIQLITFTGFGVNPSLGKHTIGVRKSGTNDIYPPSCTDLDMMMCEAADNPATEATLLPNGLCDNVTTIECTAAGGSLIRDSIDLYFIPTKTLPVISW